MDGAERLVKQAMKLIDRYPPPWSVVIDEGGSWPADGKTGWCEVGLLDRNGHRFAKIVMPETDYPVTESVQLAQYIVQRVNQ